MDSNEQLRAEVGRSLLGMQLAVQLAIGKRVADDQWTRTHCTRTLTATGHGVTHNPACDPWPLAVRYAKQAADAINPRSERLKP